MDFDGDLFADESGPAVNHARGRFQPKAKPSSIKETTVSVDVIDKDNRLLDPVGSSVPTLEVGRTVEQLKENESSDHALHSEVTNSNGCGDLHSSFQKAVGQNADVFSGLECLNDFPSQPTNGTEMPALIGYDCNAGEGVAAEGQSSDNNAAPAVCDDEEPQTCADLFMTQDPISCRQAILTNNAGGIPVDDAIFETEVQQEGAFPDLNCLDFTTEEAVVSGWCAGKCKPKHKVQRQSEKCNISVSHSDVVGSVMLSPNAQFVSAGGQYISEGSIPAPVPEDFFDYSSIDLGDTTPPDPTSEFPLNEELTNIAETYQTDAASSGDVQCEDSLSMTENQSDMGMERKASTMSSLSHRLLKSSLSGEKMEVRRSLRQLRKGVAVPELVNEPDSDSKVHNDGSFTAEPPSSAVDDGDVDGNLAEKTSKKKTAPSKSKKPVTENEMPVRKRKKANEASDKPDKGPPKKFSHSTRRKRRIVSKELLETPEDEIDPQKVPMKDLILLAEYKERLASKEAKAIGTPLTNQSAEHSSHEEDYHNEDETFDSEQGIGSIGDQANDRVQPRVHYFNYQSFMKKTPTARWSKQETELFYEAIRQFGTDLSMIQLLFPGRTRHQIKLKYKKEEREHPLRLTDALINRAKDHSHFEKLIEQLQQAAAQEAQDAKQDDSAGMTDNEVELNPKHNDKVEKVEQVQNGEGDVSEVHSPKKADESDDDNDIWSSYKTEF